MKKDLKMKIKKLYVVIVLFALFTSLNAKGKYMDNPNLPMPDDYMERPIKQMKELLPTIHPAGYFLLSAKLYGEEKFDEAIMFLYVAQIRYKAYLAVYPNLEPSGDPALFGALLNDVGQAVNGYAGQDISNWIVQIENAKRWHDENRYIPIAQDIHGEHYKEILDGLDEMVEELKEYEKKK